ncbi:hypothetical protein ACG2OD_23150 [Streptomyces sp. PDY-4]|uniref:hypothetical protein n=1 Tax=Streptomyces sp. PDY-4 TaxID=3376070 RepID=UPI0037A7DD8A
MSHPNVDQEIEVPEISVRHYERSGWAVVDDQAVPVMETAAVTDQAVTAEETAAAKGRRRRSEGEN